MAQFSLEGPGEAAATLSRGPALRLPDLGTAGAAKGDDYLSQLERLRKEREAKAASTAGLKLGAVDTGGGLQSLAESLLTPLEKRLREARTLVDQEKWAPALAAVERVLGENAAHHEALYMKGLCLLRLERPQDAMAALRPLVKVRLESQLAARVAVVRAEIRNGIALPMMMANLLLTRAGRHDEAAELLRGLLHDDPGCGVYHFMLTGTLMEAGRLEEAHEAATLGLDECDGDEKPLLEGLRNRIAQRDVEQRLAPARDHFRRGNYPRARRALQKVPPQGQAQPLFKTFQAYLEELGGSLFGLVAGKPLDRVRPKGSPKDVEALHFLLVGPDLALARLFMAQQGWGRARLPLINALRLAPHFPFPHHLTAICIYSEMAEAMAEGQPPGIDTVEAQLKAARSHAVLGAQDPEITEAQGVIAAIDAALGAMREVRRQLALREQDDRAIGAIVSAFRSIMETAKDGISSARQFRDIERRMRELKERVDAAEAVLHTDDGRESLRQLATAVDRNLEQLDELRADVEEAERIGPLKEEYESIMARASGGISSVYQLDDLKDRLVALRASIEREGPRLAGQAARELLAALAQAVDRRHGELVDVLLRLGR